MDPERIIWIASGRHGSLYLLLHAQVDERQEAWVDLLCAVGWAYNCRTQLYEGCGEFVLLGRLASGAGSDLLPYALPPGCSAGRNPGAVARTRTRHLCPPLGLAQDHRSTEATRPARVTGR